MSAHSAMVCDYRIHTTWSDGESSVGEVVAQAARLGLVEIGFTDHLVPLALDDGYGMPHERFDEYVATVRKAAAEKESPRVLLGIELDYSADTWDEATELVGRHHFDYVVGAVHAVGGVPCDLDAHAAEERWPNVDELFTSYYEAVAEVAGTGLIDVVAHLDLPKKFGRRATEAVAGAEDAALDAIARAGVLIEINTAGLRNRAREQYPSAALLEKARQRGIRITFGSDAHRPADIAFSFAQARTLAVAAGYAAWVRLSDAAEVPLS